MILFLNNQNDRECTDAKMGPSDLRNRCQAGLLTGRTRENQRAMGYLLASVELSQFLEISQSLSFLYH